MKKLSYFAMIVFTAYVMQGCHSNNTAQTTDSATSTKDSTTKTTMVDSSKADSGDVKFAKKLAGGGAAEITFSKLAEQKVKPGKLMDFATMMVTDHTKAADTLKMIAQKENIMLPPGMDPDHQKKYDDMSKMSGNDFNKAYVTLMVADHKDAVSLLQDESQNGKDSTLKKFATKILPTVQMHLDVVTKIQSNMK
jgi:putative membrane protein